MHSRCGARIAIVAGCWQPNRHAKPFCDAIYRTIPRARRQYYFYRTVTGVFLGAAQKGNSSRANIPRDSIAMAATVFLDRDFARSNAGEINGFSGAELDCCGRMDVIPWMCSWKHLHGCVVRRAAMCFSRHGISTGLASSASSSRKSTQIAVCASSQAYPHRGNHSRTDTSVHTWLHPLASRAVQNCRVSAVTHMARATRFSHVQLNHRRGRYQTSRQARRPCSGRLHFLPPPPPPPPLPPPPPPPFPPPPLALWAAAA